VELHGLLLLSDFGRYAKNKKVVKKKIVDSNGMKQCDDKGLENEKKSKEIARGPIRCDPKSR